MMVGLKDDDRKPRTDLLPPKACLEVARVLAHGASKYADNNWREVPDSTRRYVAAALRHIFACMSGEQLDPESGLSHLAHATTSLMFVLDLEGHASDFVTFGPARPERAALTLTTENVERLKKQLHDIDSELKGVDKP